MLGAASVGRADATGAADERAPRRRDATACEIFGGPFASSHLFAMPTADVVGAYLLSVHGEGSLISESGAYSFAGVAAIGFGDLAQLEYRMSAAYSNLDNREVRLPSLGVQFKIPVAEHKYLPAFAIALRLGLPREETLNDGTTIRKFSEHVNDLYVVGRLRLWGPLRRVTLHGGLRAGAASINSISKILYLPAGGWEIQMTPRTRLAGELALIPVFAPSTAGGVDTSVVETKPQGRLGIRWTIHPAVVLDASLGYRIEVARFDQRVTGGLDTLIDWDIRLGAEVFVPWGALICRAGGGLCQ